jgi:hypothetical protein
MLDLSFRLFIGFRQMTQGNKYSPIGGNQNFRLTQKSGNNIASIGHQTFRPLPPAQGDIAAKKE